MKILREQGSYPETDKLPGIAFGGTRKSEITAHIPYLRHGFHWDSKFYPHSVPKGTLCYLCFKRN